MVAMIRNGADLPMALGCSMEAEKKSEILREKRAADRLVKIERRREMRKLKKIRAKGQQQKDEVKGRRPVTRSQKPPAKAYKTRKPRIRKTAAAPLPASTDVETGSAADNANLEPLANARFVPQVSATAEPADEDVHVEYAIVASDQGVHPARAQALRNENVGTRPRGIQA